MVVFHNNELTVYDSPQIINFDGRVFVNAGR